MCLSYVCLIRDFQYNNCIFQLSDGAMVDMTGHRTCFLPLAMFVPHSDMSAMAISLLVRNLMIRGSLLKVNIISLIIGGHWTGNPDR